MLTTECFITVIAPFYNDAEIIEDFVEETIRVLRANFRDYELLLVNDGSEDETPAKVMRILQRFECIRLITLSRHFGTDIAISSGLDSAIGDFVVIMVPDSTPPGLVPELIQEARSGWDILIGVRNDRSGDPLWLRAGASFFYWFFKKMFKTPLAKNSTHFWILSRRVVNAIIQVDTNHRHLRLLTSHVGYRSKTFVYQPLQRSSNPQTRGFFDAVDYALKVVLLHTVRPLRLAGAFGLLASLGNLVGSIVAAVRAPAGRGWTALALQNSLMFFLLALVLAVLCEYTSILFERSRGWMAYHVTDEHTSSVPFADPERRNIVTESVADAALCEAEAASEPRGDAVSKDRVAMRGTTMSTLSIVLPAYNEERNLPGCMGSLRETFAGTDYEVLIVDDGSSDGTLAEARRLATEDPARVTVLAHDRNRGMGAALRTGYEAARGDYVTYCPADFAMSAADWASFAAALGRADVLVGRRLRREGYSPLMRFNSWLYLRLVRLLFGLHLRDVAWISVYRRNLVRQVTITQQGFAMLVEIIVKLRDLGASFLEVNCRMQRRTIGTPSSARFSVMWRTLMGVLGFWWTYRRVSPAPTPRPVPTDAPGATIS